MSTPPRKTGPPPQAPPNVARPDRVTNEELMKTKVLGFIPPPGDQKYFEDAQLLANEMKSEGILKDEAIENYVEMLMNLTRFIKLLRKDEVTFDDFQDAVTKYYIDISKAEAKYGKSNRGGKRRRSTKRRKSRS